MAAVLWRWLASGGRDGSTRSPSVLELAYLRGGFTLACQTCIAGLHRTGFVRTGPLSTLVATASPAATWPPLMTALHHSLRTAESWAQAITDPDVRRAGQRLRQRLLRRDLLLSSTRQRWIKAGTIPLFVVTIIGVARLAAMATDPNTAGGPGATVGLILTTAGSLLAGWLLLEVPTVSRAGRRALRRASQELTNDSDTATSAASSPPVMRKIAIGGPRSLHALAPQIAPLVGIGPNHRYPFPHLITFPRGQSSVL